MGHGCIFADEVFLRMEKKGKLGEACTHFIFIMYGIKKRTIYIDAFFLGFIFCIASLQVEQN